MLKRFSELRIHDRARVLLARYWAWTSSGSLLRFAAGTGLPLLLLVLAVQSFRGGGELPQAQSAVLEARSTASTPAAPAPASQAAAPTPTPVPKSVLTYVVKAGDSIGAICSAHVPSMAYPACVAAIVDLNKLGGPDQLSVGQTLSLPGAASASSSAGATSGQMTNAAIATSTPQAAAPATVQQTRSQITISSLSSPVKPGQNATLKAVAAPNSSCSLQYNAPAGTKAAAEGLVAKVADSSGNISWSWQINTATKKGRGTVIITCGGTTISAYIEVS